MFACVTPMITKALGEHVAGSQVQTLQRALRSGRYGVESFAHALFPLALGLIFAELSFVYGGL